MSFQSIPGQILQGVRYQRGQMMSDVHSFPRSRSVRPFGRRLAFPVQQRWKKGFELIKNHHKGWCLEHALRTCPATGHVVATGFILGGRFWPCASTGGHLDSQLSLQQCLHQTRSLAKDSACWLAGASWWPEGQTFTVILFNMLLYCEAFSWCQSPRPLDYSICCHAGGIT